MATGQRDARGKVPGEAGGARRWENLNRDVLVAIFERVGVADLIAGVPFVCSSWRNAARDPLCWRELDFRDWESLSDRLGCRLAENFDGLLQLAIDRGHGLLESIYFPYFADGFDLFNVAQRCPRLRFFSLPNPDVEKDTFCNAVTLLIILMGMAVTKNLISSEVLQHVNQHCVHFTELRVFSDFVDGDMASIICNSLPSLRKLEITESLISSQAIIMFLDGLKELEHFDISGYEISLINHVVLEKAKRLKVFIWNSRFELGEFMDCSDCDDHCPQQRSCDCMLEGKVMEWLTNFS